MVYKNSKLFFTVTISFTKTKAVKAGNRHKDLKYKFVWDLYEQGTFYILHGSLKKPYRSHNQSTNQKTVCSFSLCIFKITVPNFSQMHGPILHVILLIFRNEKTNKKKHLNFHLLTSSDLDNFFSGLWVICLDTS